ncbi:hypothetical protein, partial [Pseudomonas sp. GW531-E2]|uniref:hypothetical protein n=1 Tax=Pseudomonas sp. GW531-E2 TaxID=2070679 RepID=UPI001C472A22
YAANGGMVPHGNLRSLAAEGREEIATLALRKHGVSSAVTRRPSKYVLAGSFRDERTGCR